jgi:biotin carboxyl carrier protein
MSKFNAKVNDKFDFGIELKGKDVVLDGKKVNLDLIKKSSSEMHVLRDGKSYTAELIKHFPETKEVELMVNGNRYMVALQDEYDLLLDSLGLSAQMNVAETDFKAPMPGLVFEINVKEGDSVKKGDALLILEAMKMENVLKATTDAVIQSIKVNKGESVEKNQVLIQFEA